MMKPTTGTKTLFLVVAVAGLLGFQTTKPDNTLPPGHPTVNPLPPGHPPLGEGVAPEIAGPPPPAAPDDVASPEAIAAAYYEAMSGPVGAPRDWARFRSLFLPGARLMTLVQGRGGSSPVVLEAHEFAAMNDRYFEATGYVERPIEQQVDELESVAHVWSIYEGRRGDDDESTTRGATSFQLLRGGGRWWIASVAWDRDRSARPDPAADR